MYAVTSIPLVSRIRAIFRTAELGFLGVVVVTLVHTPRLKGAALKVGLFSRVLNPRRSAVALERTCTFFRGFFTNWFTVGIVNKND
jgi:hypothetical protein